MSGSLGRIPHQLLDLHGEPACKAHTNHPLFLGDLYLKVQLSYRARSSPVRVLDRGGPAWTLDPRLPAGPPGKLLSLSGLLLSPGLSPRRAAVSTE